MGRVVKTTDPMGNFSESWYDDAGNVIEIKRTDKSTLTGTNNEVFRDTYFYDSLGRLAAQVGNANALGAGAPATYLRYNSRGQTVATADANAPAGRTRTFHRRGDSSNAVTANDFGNVTLMDYDGAGRLTRQRLVMTDDGRGDGVHIGRTTTGASETAPTPDTDQGGGDGYIDTRNEYDAAGQPAALIDDNGNKTVWTYDAQGRKVAETKGVVVAPALATRQDTPTTIHWNFDTLGRLSAQTKEDGSVLTYSYDPFVKKNT